MERETFVGMVDVGLSFFRSYSAGTESPVDDTICRYLDFARNDASFERIMDRIFGDDGAPTEGEVAELKASFNSFRGKDAEAITADEFISVWLPIILNVFRAFRDRKKVAPPAAA